MKRSSLAKGFSLLEVVVYQAILLMLMGGLYITVISGMRFLRTSDVYQDVIRQAHIGLHKMSRELTNGSQGSLNFSAAPTPHVVFLSPEVLLPNRAQWTYSGSDLQYHKWVCFYRNAPNQSLVRCEEAATGAPVTWSGIPPVPDFATVFQPLAVETLARFIVNLEFTAGVTSGSIDIRLTAERQTSSDRQTALEVRANVRLENP